MVQEASAGVRVVLDCYEAGGLRLCMTPDIYQNPYLHLMAILVAVVKAQYQDHPRQLRQFDWQQWALTVLRNTSSRHPPGLQVASWPKAQHSTGRMAGDKLSWQAVLHLTMWLGVSARNFVLRERQGCAGIIGNDLACLNT